MKHAQRKENRYGHEKKWIRIVYLNIGKCLYLNVIHKIMLQHCLLATSATHSVAARQTNKAKD
jgi:hypothetical protein